MAAHRGIEHIEIVVCIRRLQRSLDAGKAGIGNGTGGQTDVGIGVIRAVHPQIFGSQICFAAQSIDDGGIDVQIGRIGTPAEQTVVDDGGDGISLLGAGGFLFDHGRNVDHIFDRELVAVDILLTGALMKSARADSERFCFLRKFEKSRNTVCISDFPNCTEGEKDPLLSRRRFIQRFP